MLADHDPMEDVPFSAGVTMTDWTGLPWKDIPPERVKVLTYKDTRKGRVTAFLSKVPAGEGRKLENLPDIRTARLIQNSLYRAAKLLWGEKTIKIKITHDEGSGSYQVEFVHLPPPENENNKPSKVGKPKAWKEKQKEELAKDELHALCLRYATPTVTSSTIYNLLKRGDIDTVEDLKGTSLEDILKIRNLGKEKLAVISKMKEGLDG